MSNCEWDPILNQSAFKDSEHEEKAIININYKGSLHLCSNCANLPIFKRFKKNMMLKHDEYHPDRIIHFGVHQGKRWRDVPFAYLNWFSQNAYEQMLNRKEWALKEIERRKNLRII